VLAEYGASGIDRVPYKPIPVRGSGSATWRTRDWWRFDELDGRTPWPRPLWRDRVGQLPRHVAGNVALFGQRRYVRAAPSKGSLMPQDVELVRLLLEASEGLGESVRGLVTQAARRLMELAPHAPRAHSCRECGAKLVQPSTGRRREFCSDAHRKRYARRLSEVSKDRRLSENAAEST
jgi:hypothetical protein